MNFRRPRMYAGSRRAAAWLAGAMGVLVGASLARGAHAQTPVRPAVPDATTATPLTLSLRGVPVAEALDRFAAASGASLAFDPAVVGTQRVFCQVEDAPPESMLRCIVREAGLDFYRLSSGTYVVIASLAMAPQYAALAGQVTDAASGEPVPLARVVLDQAGGARAVNESGSFRFATLLPGRYRVRVQAVGYRPLEREVELAPGRTARWRLPLDPLPTALALVEVTGLTPSIAFTGAQPVAVDSTPAALAAGGLLRAAANQLGVGQRALAGDLHIQGGEAGEHQYRLDGVPVFDPISVARLFGAFTPLAIRQLIVHKAGFGVTHGSYTAGVVDLEHSLGAGTEGLATHVDPVSAAARYSTRTTLGGRRVQGMLTGRRSLWDVNAVPSIAQAFDGWARVDPLLLGRSGGGPVAPGVAPFTIDRHAPDLRFVDVHGAGRIELGAFRSVSASAFVSRNAVSADVRAFGPEGLDKPRSGAALAVETRDAYAWRTVGGMVRHDWLPTARVQQTLRLRVSAHELMHRHHAARPEVDALDGPMRHESNAVSEVALDATARIGATDGGEVALGTEVARTGSRMAMDNGVFRPMQTDGSAWRIAQFAEWRQRLPRGLHLDGGLRLTWVPTFASVYGEPRVALRGEHDRAGGVIAWRVAGSVHRQFISQFELPALGPTAVASGVRFWLPVDGTIRPAEAYHTAAEFVWSHRSGFEVRAEGYHKWLTSLPALDFAVLLGEGDALPHDMTQADFIGTSRGRTAGAGVRVAQETRWWRASAGADVGHSVRTFPGRFDGRLTRTPWNESLRVTSSFEARLPADVSVSMQSRSVWGRAWALRRAYYDLALDGLPVDAPDADRLPAWHEVDLALGRTFRVAGAQAELSVSALNLLARANVIDAWLVPDTEGAAFTRAPRIGIGRQLLFTVRVRR
jgi:hypothetical protein